VSYLLITCGLDEYFHHETANPFHIYFNRASAKLAMNLWRCSVLAMAAMSVCLWVGPHILLPYQWHKAGHTEHKFWQFWN